MHAIDLIRLFAGPLETAGITYMVTGSVAATLFGQPRMTEDVDMVVELHWSRARQLEALFPPPAYYCTPEEVMRVQLMRDTRGHANVIHQETGMKAYLYFAGADPLHRWALPLRRREQAGDLSFWLAPPEYVILRKLLFHREGGSEKHLRDIRAMMDVSGPSIDRVVLSNWAVKLGLTLPF
jgi:hypothetical protein